MTATGDAAGDALAARLSGTRWPSPLRLHQEQALDELERAFAAGRRRTSVVLPPGAGKTLVGLEAARRRGRPVVAFGPNTAIQSQWVQQWRAFTPPTVPVGTDRDLTAPVTALTYQALATFDPDAEVDEEGHGAIVGGGDSSGLLGRLHDNGRALVDALAGAGPLTVILDECHHLLEVWGRLLVEVLDQLPEGYVIGLTATPPETLSGEQAVLVAELFGAPVYTTTIPAVVRQGHLAPFAELAWLTAPSSRESQWLAAEAERFAELRTELLDPGFASVPFLDWLDARFVRREGRRTADSHSATGPGTVGLPVSWARLEKDSPQLADAALRLVAAGLLARPDDARIREEHRHPPSPADWVALIEDYVRGCLAPSERPHDAAAIEAIRVALPAVGYQLTRRGIRSGRSPVDRVLARSEAKTHAAVEIVATEAANLGSKLRALLLTDHERATATLPARLAGVLDREAGSARLLLENLVADPRTAVLSPILVTARTVAAEVQTARAIVEFAAARAPQLGLDPVNPDATGVVEVTGRWTSRTWVPLVTAFFEQGLAQVLVGTRGLLGEGWDARRVNTVIDLTTATTPTAVVQTRGRALRVDPCWPDKVANNWTVVCVTEAHPNGTSDWDRFVRKHDGYLAVTDSGEVAAGVTHVDPALSPYVPPPSEAWDRVNAAMLVRAQDRNRVRALWRVGTPYRDALVHTIRVTPTAAPAARAALPPGAEPAQPPAPPVLLPEARGALRRPGCPNPARQRPAVWAGGLASGVALTAAGLPALIWLASLLAVLVTAVAVHRRLAARAAGQLLASLAGPPGLLPFAYAVADGLEAAGLSPRGAAAVVVTVEPSGAYRLALDGVPTEASQAFAQGLDDVLAPIASPRYLIPRYLVNRIPAAQRARAGRAWLSGRSEPNAVVYHALPSCLGANAKLAKAFAVGWNRWVSAGEPIYTGSPESAGILATSRGEDPFAATTALRVGWT